MSELQQTKRSYDPQCPTLRVHCASSAPVDVLLYSYTGWPEGQKCWMTRMPYFGKLALSIAAFGW